MARKGFHIGILTYSCPRKAKKKKNPRAKSKQHVHTDIRTGEYKTMKHGLSRQCDAAQTSLTPVFRDKSCDSTEILGKQQHSSATEREATGILRTVMIFYRSLITSTQGSYLLVVLSSTERIEGTGQQISAWLETRHQLYMPTGEHEKGI